MKVKIEYVDNESLTVEEVVAQIHSTYGKNVKIEMSPESSMAYDHAYFALQQLITKEQLSLLYDKGANYQAGLKKLRLDIIYKIEEIIDQVIIDNESKVA
jgi:hypothetical protein